MGAGRTTRQKIDAFADRIDATLLADEVSDATMRVATKSKLRVVLHACGFEKSGARNLQRIEQALEDRGVYAHPPLTTPGLDRDRVVYFARTPWTGDGEQQWRFPVEFHLNQFLVANFELVFPDLRLVKSEFEVPSGFIDILAKDDDSYVVIELKKDMPTNDLVHNLSGYMADVAEWARTRRGPKQVRGLVIAGVWDERMCGQLRTLAEAEGLTVEWRLYRARLSLEEPTDRR